MFQLPQPAAGKMERVQSKIGPLWFRTDDDVMRPYVRKSGSWEPGETAIVQKLVKTSFRILDVGAHIGYFSVVAHRAAHGVVIDAIEPDPFSARIAELNLFEAGANARVWTCGLGDARGALALNSAVNNPGDSRVLPQAVTAEILVPVVAADELFPDAKFDIIKIDVQGHEREVMLGMRSLLQRNLSTKVLLEFFPTAIIEKGVRPIDVLLEYESMGFLITTIVGDQLRDLSLDQIISACADSGPSGFLTLLLHRD